MASKKKTRRDAPKEQRTTGRKDSGTGNSSDSGVDGIAGTGGSSGAGSTRTRVRAVGDVSGIDAELEAESVPVPGSIGKGKSGARDKQASDGGLSGKTRGPDDETTPNQSGPS